MITPRDIAGTGRKVFFLIRSDQELALQVRQLFLIMVIGLACAYGAHVLFIQPRQDIIAKRQEHIATIQGQSSPGQTELLAARLHKLGREITAGKQRLDILTLQEELLREQWSQQADNDRFHQVMFTLAASAPLNMQQDLLKMEQESPRSMDGFTLFPVSLAGRSSFEKIFLYLSFLETSPEIGFLDRLELTSQPADQAEKALVDFTINLGRLEVADE